MVTEAGETNAVTEGTETVEVVADSPVDGVNEQWKARWF